MEGSGTNPIRILRVGNHKSLQEASLASGVHLQTFYLNECGVYPEILPKIKSYLVRTFGVDPHNLELNYTGFVKNKRKSFSAKYLDRIEQLPEPDLTVPPLQQFREHIDLHLNRTKFSKSICVEPAGLYRLETYPLSDIPGRVNDALLEIGMSKETLEELQERTYEFHARFRK